MRETRAKKVTRPSKCTSCKMRALCSKCAATAELENGDAEAPVDYFCEVAHLRAQALGYEPPAHGDCAFCAGGDKHARLLEGLAEMRRSEPAQRRRRRWRWSTSRRAPRAAAAAVAARAQAQSTEGTP